MRRLIVVLNLVAVSMFAVSGVWYTYSNVPERVALGIMLLINMVSVWVFALRGVRAVVD